METELLTSQLTTAYMISALLQWLKNKPWFPFTNINTAALNRATAMALAFITAVGLHYTFDAEGGVLTITGLTVANIAHTAWASVQQYALQQGVYKGLVKKGDS